MKTVDAAAASLAFVFFLCTSFLLFPVFYFYLDYDVFCKEFMDGAAYILL